MKVQALAQIVTAASAALVAAAGGGCSQAKDRAESSTKLLISNQNSEWGLWGPLGDFSELNGGTWWSSASLLSFLLKFQEYDPGVRDSVIKAVETSFKGAQKYRLTIDKDNDKLKKLENKPTPFIPGTFSNGAYDDEGWWGIAWAHAYDATKDKRYLEAAENIFDGMTQGWDQTKCGGMLWSNTSTFVNAITNELFLNLASMLANRASDKDKYLKWAKDEWKWFQQAKFINKEHLFNDGLLENCENNNDVTWTYNQGVILGALVEYAKATNDNSVLDYAHKTAKATIKHLVTKDGILTDQCEPKCYDNSLNTQFKGVFVHNLGLLNAKAPKQEYADFLDKNANTLWDKARDDKGLIFEVWSGPINEDGMTNSSLSSGVACLIENYHAKNCSK